MSQQGDASLSLERELALRSAVRSEKAPVDRFDAQDVVDLLAEIDRLRALLQGASQARQLLAEAARTLRDSTQDIVPRPFRKRAS
jgi:hypothetical protein